MLVFLIINDVKETNVRPMQNLDVLSNRLTCQFDGKSCVKIVFRVFQCLVASGKMSLLEFVSF